MRKKNIHTPASRNRSPKKEKSEKKISVLNAKFHSPGSGKKNFFHGSPNQQFEYLIGIFFGMLIGGLAMSSLLFWYFKSMTWKVFNILLVSQGTMVTAALFAFLQELKHYKKHNETKKT